MPDTDLDANFLMSRAKQHIARRNAQHEHHAIILRRHRVEFVNGQTLDLIQPRLECTYHDSLVKQHVASVCR